MTLYGITFKGWLIPPGSAIDISKLDPWLRLDPEYRDKLFYYRTTAEEVVRQSQVGSDGSTAQWEIDAIEFDHDLLERENFLELCDARRGYQARMLKHYGGKYIVRRTANDAWLRASQAAMLNLALGLGRIECDESFELWCRVNNIRQHLEPLEHGQRVCGQCLKQIGDPDSYSPRIAKEVNRGRCPACRSEDTRWQVANLESDRHSATDALVTQIVAAPWVTAMVEAASTWQLANPDFDRKTVFDAIFIYPTRISMPDVVDLFEGITTCFLANPELDRLSVFEALFNTRPTPIGAIVDRGDIVGRQMKGGDVTKKGEKTMPDELATRFRRYQRVVEVLEMKLADPQFLRVEKRKRQMLMSVGIKYATLTHEHKQILVDHRAALIARIGAINAAETARARQAPQPTSWWAKLFGSASPSVRPGTVAIDLRKRFGPLGHLGPDVYFVEASKDLPPTPDNFEMAEECVEKYNSAVMKILDLEKRYERLRSEEEKPFWPYRFRGFDVKRIGDVKKGLRETEGELEKLGVSEAQIRRKYGLNDATIAQAAAYTGLTRELADKIRPVLLLQLKEGRQCPYCGGDVGDTPHADHIFPVTLGGLSTADNLVLVCEVCNLQKSGQTLAEFAVKYGRDRAVIEANLRALKKRF